MKVLIYLHGQKEDQSVDHITFPTGEKHIRIRDLTTGDDIVLFYNDPSGDVMKLGMAVDICRRVDVKSITLVIPFVPYARQDRVAVEGDPFSIRVFTGFVNSLRLDKIIITDPHSEVTPALLDNVVIVPQHEIAMEAVLELDQHLTYPLAIVAPDLGAAKKLKALQAHIKQVHGLMFPIIQCDKTRDVETGNITGFKILEGADNATGRHCVMVDDICDGGGTFIGLSDIIHDAQMGNEGQSLFVTHGIFSKGVKTLLGHFDYIYTSNSFPAPEGVRVVAGNIQ